MSSHISFLKRLIELTRNHAVVWHHDADAAEYDACVESYTARLSYSRGGMSAAGQGLRFTLMRRDETVVEVGTRRRLDFQMPDDANYQLKALFEAIQKQQSSRETAAFEDFLTRAEA